MKPYVQIQVCIFGLEDDEEIPIAHFQSHSRSGKSLSGLATGVVNYRLNDVMPVDKFKTKEEFLASVSNVASLIWDQHINHGTTKIRKPHEPQ